MVILSEIKNIHGCMRKALIMPIRKAFLISVLWLAVGASPVVAEVLPENLLDELAPLMDSSSTSAIDPGVYELSEANQAYADEIACILVKFFGQSEQVEKNMLAVVDDDAQKDAVSSSISSCLAAGEDFGMNEYGSVKKNFNQSLTRGN